MDRWIERKKRQYLKDVLPLVTPFSVQVYTTLLCNFKCVYCVHSCNTPLSLDKFIDVPLFHKFCSDMEMFPNKIKTVTFTGLGEPLLHPHLPEMVAAAKLVAEEVVVVTNGALLNEKMAEQLVFSGLDCVRISLQGLTEEEYFAVCGKSVDQSKFKRNISYLHKLPGNCKVYVKIPDICIEADEKKEMFFREYGNICDGISIQSIVPADNGVDYTKIKFSFEKTIHNDPLQKNIFVCPMPFYSAVLGTNGEISPCCWSHPDNRLVLGNIKTDSFYDIWNGSELQLLRKIHLKKQRSKLEKCRNCDQLPYIINEYDFIDEQSEILYAKFFA